MSKIQMKTPLVEMDGDEMTRIIWKSIKDILITPYVDLKGGYSPVGYFEGLYLAPTIGCRFGLTRRVGLNVGIGYSLQQTNTKYYEWDPLDKIENKTMNFHGLSFKFGFDF